MSVRYKFIILISATLLTTIFSIVYLISIFTENTIINQNYATCKNLSELISSVSREELFVNVNNFENLQDIINTVENYKIFGLQKIYVVNTKGIIVVSSEDSEKNKILSLEELKYINEINSLSFKEIEGINDIILKYTSPIYLIHNNQNYKLGAAIFEFSNKELFLPLNNLKNQIFNLSLFIIIFSIIGSLLLTNYIIKPIEKLKIGIEKFSKGDLDYNIKLNSNDEFGTLAINFNQMAEKLSEIDRLKDEFLANTSHELKTPLNGIIGIAEGIKYSNFQLDNSIIENLDYIIGSGKRLNSLVNDILDFSIIKKNQLSLNFKSLNLRSIVNFVIFVLQNGIKNPKVEIKNLISKEFRYVYADENRLQQILYNLIGNAIKFTEIGEIEITATDALSYRTSRGGEKLSEKAIISIRDTGIGIEENKLSKIFEQFEQGDSSIQRKYGGTGLGLAITKKLIDLHGCNLWVESEVNIGSTFYFTLPFSEDSKMNTYSHTELIKSDSHTLTLAPKENNQTFHNSPIILIIDDEPINIKVIENHLINENYNILSSNNGKESLKIIKENKIDLILLDLMMPELSGFELTEIIRRTHDLSQLPIIIITARNQLSDFTNAFESGVNDYISKPITREELLSRVKTQLELKRLNEKLEELVSERTKELNEIKKEIESINIFTRIINEHSNMREIFINISQYLFLHYDIETSLLLLLSENKKYYESFRFYSYHKIPKDDLDYTESLKIPIHEEDNALKFITKRKKPYYFSTKENVTSDIDKEFLSKLNIHSGLLVPLIIQSEIIGVYFLTNISKEMKLKKMKIFSINKFLRQTAGSINGIRLLLESNKAKSQLESEKLKLESTLIELNQAQKTLIESEKMAALGQLISNVSHELNTPIGAIKATSYNIKNSINNIFSSLEELNSLNNLNLIFEFINYYSKNSNLNLSTRIEREKKKEVSKIIRSIDESIEDQIIEVLSDLKIFSIQEKFKPLFRGENRLKIFEFIASIIGLANKSQLIETAVEKTSKIIFTLKNYENLNRETIKKEYNIQEGINSTIIKYNHIINQDIIIKKDFQINPIIKCNPEEMNQVWNNLFLNSLQSLNSKGEIYISLCYSNKNILITFKDNGVGITLDNQKKIFNTFFTTKKAGDGSGLGLMICKKIIDKYNGTIQFSSMPGETIFYVNLPI